MLSELSVKQKVIIMIGVLLSMLLSALDQTIVATAMPRIVQELHGLEYLSWVVTSYLLTSTIVIPIAGKLSDIFGRKVIFVIGICIFLAGSMLSGISPNIGLLIAFRGLQGIGAGILGSISFTIIGDLFVPSERGKWQGLFGGVFGLASVVGPIMGGWLTDNVSWRWNFFINLPVGIAALIAIIFLMPNIKADIAHKSIDYKGIVALSAGLSALLLALVWGGTQYPWASIQILGLFAAAALALTAFVFIQYKADSPLLPLSLFKNRIFTVSVIITFLFSIAMFGAILYIPLFAQDVLGVDATNSGTILTPMVITMIIASIIAGQLISRLGRYKLLAITGLAIMTASFFYLGTISAVTTQNGLFARMIIAGVGLGLAMPVFTLAVQNAFDHSKLAVATASIQLFRNIGSTVGTAITGSLLNNMLTQNLSTLDSNAFAKNMGKLNPSFSLQDLNVNSIQYLLTPQFATQVKESIVHLPLFVQQNLLQEFANFAYGLKSAIATSIAHIYSISAILLILAFIAAFFLQEIPLRKSHRDEMDAMPVEEAEIQGEPLLSVS